MTARPRPVLTVSSIVGVVTTLATVLGFLGFASLQTTLNGEAQAIGALIVGAVTVGSHLYAGFKAQDHVTPNSDPRNAAGEKLEPATPKITVSGASLNSYVAAQSKIAAASKSLEDRLSTATINVSDIDDADFDTSGIDDTPIPLDPEVAAADPDAPAVTEHELPPPPHAAEHAAPTA